MGATGAVPRLSVVIPAFNEEHRIKPTMDRVLTYLKSQPYPCEIIVVDDGSTDRTARVVEDFQGQGVEILQNGSNKGKGFAVKVGMLHARGDYILFTDADLSTPIEELDKLWESFAQGYDIVIGSRRLRGAQIQVHQPWWRESMGRVFTWLTAKLVTGEISDVTCGFKGFSRAAARDIFLRQRLHDWTFDAEVLFIARQRGYRIQQVAVRWQDMPGTKVRLLRDTVRSLVGLLRIRAIHLRGGYQ